MYIRPFDIQADTVNAAVTATTAVLAVNATPIGTRSILISNVGSQTIFVKLGTASTVVTLTGTNAGIPIFANTAQAFLIRNEQTHVAHIAAGTGSTIYATIGEGA